MRTVTIPSASAAGGHPAAGHPWSAMVLVLVMLTGAFSVTSVARPPAAQAATTTIDQCNGHAPAAEGATTDLRCTVTVVNTISGKRTSSVTTVTRLCLLGPCSTPNGTFTTRSNSVVTTVQQCNNSDNDAAHTISCEVRITNNISASAADAKPLTRASTNQCAGSAAAAAARCTPSPARAGAATVTQCNGSANGGGGKLDCSVDPASRVSRAIPITVNQCNGTGNPGGSSVSCQASVITRITAAAAATATPTPTPSATTTTAAKTAKATPSPSATTTPGALLVGSDSTDGPKFDGLLMLLAALVLVAAIGALLYRRYAPAGWPLVRRD